MEENYDGLALVGKIVKIETVVKIKMEEGCEDLFPVKAHEFDAGFDLKAAEDTTLYLNEVKAISVGFKMAMENGWEAQIRPRSGLALKHGIIVKNSPGTICSLDREIVCVIISYTGILKFENEVKNIIEAESSETYYRHPKFEIKRGDKIAQMVIKRVPIVRLEKVDSLDII